MAQKISPSFYEEICNSSASHLIGDWIFSSHAFPSTISKNKEYEHVIRNLQIKIKERNKFLQNEEVIKVKQLIPRYLEDVLNLILAKEPKIVGFSTNFQQTCASIAIANLIKKANPDIFLVLGGYNCSQVMGQALLEISPSIDYVFSGEADFEFLRFCSNILKNKFSKNRFINCLPIENLNLLPYPDFSDYFNQIEDLGFENEFLHACFEGSRGCWWGSSSHCLFCGVNGAYLKFRQKTPERVQKEINFLLKKNGIEMLFATDAIMAEKFPSTLFKEFKKPFKLKSISYEVRPIFTFEELYFLKKKGINSLQPGIETLNNHLSNLLNKRLRTLNNIRFLRDCRTLGIILHWNFLYGVPGETQEDYRKMVKILPSLYHLQSPERLNRLRIQRFSPLFDDAEKYRIKNLRPAKGYSYLFPENTNFQNLALYFQGEYDSAFTNEELKKTFSSSIHKWQNLWENHPPCLSLIHLTDEFYLVEDSRPVSQANFQIIEDGHFKLLKTLREPFEEINLKSFVKSHDLSREFEELLDWGYILNLNKKFLSLIIEPMRVIEHNRNFKLWDMKFQIGRKE